MKYGCSESGVRVPWCVEAKHGQTYEKFDDCDKACGPPEDKTRWVCGGYGQCVKNSKEDGHQSRSICQQTCTQPPPMPCNEGNDCATLNLLPDVNSTKGRCLDGSPGGYYTDLKEGSKDWIIFLVAGGNCKSMHSCLARAKNSSGKAVGSSKGWPSTAPGNPFPGSLKNWNYVQMQYCSGDSFTGTRGWYNGWKVHIAGHIQLEEAVADLQKHHKDTFPQPGQKSNSRVMLTGDSSGARGVFTNAEWLSTTLSGADVIAAPFGGWFYPNVTTYNKWLKQKNGGWESDPGFWTNSTEYLHWKTYLPPSCVSHTTKGSLHRKMCSTAGYLAKWLTVPTFVAENQFDPEKANPLGCTGCRRAGMPGNHSASGRWLEYMQYYARRTVEGVVPFVNQKQNAGFMPSCYDHDQNLWNGAQPYFGEPHHPAKLAGKTALEALDQWVQGRAGPPPADDPQRKGWFWSDQCDSTCEPCDKLLSRSGTCKSPWRSCGGPPDLPDCPAPFPKPPSTGKCLPKLAESGNSDFAQ